jgi:hypothetical protein
VVDEALNAYLAARSPQGEDHETSDAVRGDLHGTPGEWPERQPTDPDRGQLRDAATPASGRGRQSARPEQPPPDRLGGQPPDPSEAP